ncbi:MAG TPA: hypothetical protein VK206_10570 [Anaerolineales bacterium]|nr:hypothetical protein [Anaerolineales bacterium]HLO29400.1 hypothetical protein [Anaerolineales bacterium]
MKRKLIFPILFILTSFACSSTSTSVPLETKSPASATATAQIASLTSTKAATETPSASETPSPLPSRTPLPTVESLKAAVTANLLSCRYGPGPDYLYLFALRATANIKLIGRVDAGNWNWVLVENQVPCWVNAKFLEVQGDIKSLPAVYPGSAKLPITPYYRSSAVLSAKRDNATHKITVSWLDVPVSLGDYESDTMQTYIVEVWRCQAGQLIFDPLATRLAYINFVDEPGCSEPSHGRVWVQEKHGYAGPAEIPWPK